MKKLILLLIIFMLIPLSVLAEDVNKKEYSNNKEIIMFIKNECGFYSEPIEDNKNCSISKDNFKAALPLNFPAIDFSKDVKISSFKTSEGIDNPWKYYKHNDKDLWILYQDAGNRHYVQDPTDKPYEDYLAIFTHNPYLIKGTVKNIPFSLYVKVYWYDM